MSDAICKGFLKMKSKISNDAFQAGTKAPGLYKRKKRPGPRNQRTEMGYRCISKPAQDHVRKVPMQADQIGHQPSQASIRK